MYLYKHKSSGKFYVCSVQATNIPVYNSRDNALMFYQSFGRFLPMEYSRGFLEFSDFTTKSKFMAIIE